MKENEVIMVDSIAKKYVIGQEKPEDQLSEAITNFIKNPLGFLRSSNSATYSDFWALKDISFNVKKGEVIGIIGKNGAGKSTLLKILSRITEPTNGLIKLKGRVSSLLEVGTGFHPELTGRENINLNGSILGMNKKEIESKFEDIVEFSGVSKFLDTPVKRYSSGMYVRLAFAVAAHLEPEILLVDEVLAVGDAAFQKKCLGKMSSVSKEGRTIFFVSHNMAAIQSLCQRTILIDKGQIAFDGDTETAISRYLRDVREESIINLVERKDRAGNGLVRFTKTWIESDSGEKVDDLLSGSNLKIVLEYESSLEKIPNLGVSLGLKDPLGTQLSDIGTSVTGVNWENLPPKGKISCSINEIPLNAGHYTYNICGRVNSEIVDWISDAGGFQVVSGDFFGSGKLLGPDQGHFLFKSEWNIE